MKNIISASGFNYLVSAVLMSTLHAYGLTHHSSESARVTVPPAQSSSHNVIVAGQEQNA
jgi:hypothetical protein